MHCYAELLMLSKLHCKYNYQLPIFKILAEFTMFFELNKTCHEYGRFHELQPAGIASFTPLRCHQHHLQSPLRMKSKGIPCLGLMQVIDQCQVNVNSMRAKWLEDPGSITQRPSTLRGCLVQSSLMMIKELLFSEQSSPQWCCGCHSGPYHWCLISLLSQLADIETKETHISWVLALWCWIKSCQVHK